MPDQPPPVYTQPKPRGMSCLAKGCTTIAVLLALLFMLLVAGGIYMKRQFGSYYGEERLPLAANTTTDAQYQVALGKLQPLVGAGNEAAPQAIDLTADDLNALVAHDPRLASAKDKCFFTIPGDQLSVDISSEIPQNNPRATKTYYFNVRVIGTVSVEGGKVDLEPGKVQSFSGSDFPGWLLSSSVFQSMVSGFNQSLNKDIHDNTDLSAMVDKIQSAKIQNGHLRLTPVNGGTTPTAP